MSLSKDVIEGCIHNNRTSQEVTYQHYYGFMLSIGLRYIDDYNDAKLMVNESFFKVFTKIKQYDTHIPFEVWMRRIMINTCIDFLRKNKKQKFNISLAEEKNQYQVEQLSTINHTEAHVEKAALDAMLLKVPETSRKAFCLFAIDGYSHKEISDILGINEGTSKWHVNNARKILKSLLQLVVKKNEKKNYAQ